MTIGNCHSKLGPRWLPGELVEPVNLLFSANETLPELAHQLGSPVKSS